MQRVLATCLLVLALAAGSSDANGTGSSAGSNGSGCSLQQAGTAPVPIDASVVLLFQDDVTGGLSSPCFAMVNRVAQYKGRAINFVITGSYADVNGDGIADVLGFRQSQANRVFMAYDQPTVAKFSAGLAACMRHAVDLGFSIAVHIHLDDGLMRGTWRNSIILDPSQKYPQLSYWDALLQPVAQAVAAANWRKGTVYFAMQAEMGATVFYYPRKYRAMLQTLKSIMAATGTPQASIRVGINVNWQKICGCPANLMDSTKYYSEFQRDWATTKQQFNVADVQALFRSIDWIGISAYAGLPLRLTPEALEASCRSVDQELALWGMSLKSLGKEIVLSEYGLGGGMSADYSLPAANPAIVAANPYWGVDGPYSLARDPWANQTNRQWMRSFYNTTLQYAQRGGGPVYPINSIFLWSVISYDVLAIHYWSTTAAGSYLDRTVAAAITHHNTALQTSRRP